MPITDIQFKLLALRYMFDEVEARKYLGIGPPGKLSSVPGSTIPRIVHPSELTNPKKTSKSATTGQKRGPTGYHLFLSHYKDRVRDEIIARGGGGPGVVSIIAQKWKELPDEKKKAWNSKAKASGVAPS